MRVTQADIDAIEYPPTHTYRLEGLKPTGVLAERVAILNHVAPGFFVSANRFLDIGASKGFFSLLAMQNSRVVALENDPVCLSLLRRLGVPVEESFDKLTGVFDRVWIGNAHHYLFTDHGWGWIENLPCSGELLVEGPAGMDCPDMGCIPERLRPLFTRAQWIGSLETWYDILSETPAASYTPGRFVWHCRKRTEPASYGERVLVPLYRSMAKHILWTDTVLEIGVREDRGNLSREIFECARFIAADRNPERVELAGGGEVLDVLVEQIPEADVVVTTALIHHTGKSIVPLLIKRLCAAAKRMLLISGPDVREQPLPYGDHRWHLNVDELVGMASDNGFALIEESKVGTGDVFLALRRI